MKPITIRLLKILAGLVVAALVLHTALLVFSGLALRNAREKLRAAGRPMAIAEIIPAPVPPSDNAAPLYKSALSLLESEAVGEKTLRLRLVHAGKEFDVDPDSPDKRQAFEQLLANVTVAQALELVERAADRPRCNFDLPYEQGILLDVPHASGMMATARILYSKAALEMRQGNPADAWRTVETSLRMANALRDEPTLISALVRIAQYRVALSSVTSLSSLTPPDDATIARLAPLLAPADDAAPFILALDGERIIYGEWMYAHMQSGTFKEIMNIDEEGFWADRAMDLLSYRPFLQADHAAYLRIFAEYADKAARPFWDFPTADLDDPIPWFGTVSRFIVPNLPRSRAGIAIVQAKVRVVQAGLALLRHQAAHGAYPATLAEIDPEFLKEIPIDPFTGQPLVYRPEGDGFVLYSLGENLRDDNGTPEPADPRGTKDFDVVWRSPNGT